MALRKSELYSSLWSSCDELRGGMDASQYKDYVLVLLFIKYVSDKYAGQPYAPITIPPGASFKDMVALKGKPDIGDQINKKIIAPLANANKLSDFPDFNDAAKLGTGKELVDRLTNLVAIFENPALDFSKNRAEGDDILGDAYEYLNVFYNSVISARPLHAPDIDRATADGIAATRFGAVMAMAVLADMDSNSFFQGGALEVSKTAFEKIGPFLQAFAPDAGPREARFVPPFSI